MAAYLTLSVNASEKGKAYLAAVWLRSLLSARFPTPLLLLAIAWGASAGCLRYIAPVTVEESPEPGAPRYVEDDSLFFAHEREQARRRNRLIAERASLIDGDDYRVGPGDVLELRVFEAPELASRVRVMPNGEASFPVIGPLPVHGATLAEVRNAVASRLKAYLRNTALTLTLAETQSRQVGVIGEVRQPGVYPLRGGRLTIIEALADAGGLRETAGSGILLLPAEEQGAAEASNNWTKSIGGRRAGVEFTRAEIFGDRGQPPIIVPLVPGDTVVVRAAAKVDVDGEVNRPGSYTLTTDATLLSALAAAGGITYSASLENVQVIRDLNDGRFAVKTFNLEELVKNKHTDVPLRPSDIVRVNSGQSRFFTRQVVESLNRFLTLRVAGDVSPQQ